MPAPLSFASDPREPLAPEIRPGGAAAPSVQALRFEYSSRGDRVPGRLLLPAAATGPVPLVLLEHGAGGHKHVSYLDATALPWVRQGVAVATIDLPLHGERASDKLTGWLLESLGERIAGETRDLWAEFVRQAVVDLRRALDALLALPSLDPQRVAYAGFSLGALVGACFCAADARPVAAALALAGGGIGPSELDPIDHIGAIAPRPLLLVNATRDARIPREAAERLFDAAGEPKQQLWFEAAHDELPGAALKAIWRFLSDRLAHETGRPGVPGGPRTGRLHSG